MPLSYEEIFNQTKVKRGQLLLSEPFMHDPNFSRKVILLCEHEEREGTYGLVLNEQTEYSLSDALEIDDADHPVFRGGPVEQDTLHYLHSFQHITDATHIKDGIYYGGNLEQLLSVQPTANDLVRFFVGYSGWGKQQLLSEMKQGSWMVSTVDLKKALILSADDLWKEVLKEMGGWYHAISNSPNDPSLN